MSEGGREGGRGDRGDRAGELVLDVPEDSAPEVHCRRDSGI